MASTPPSDADIARVAERLPTAPRLLVELGRLVNDSGSDSKEVVALLRQDPPLVAQVIRMANSAAFAPPEPIGSLERALAFMGFAEVHRLVGAVAANQMADERVRLYPVDGPKLRLHTLYVAVLMEELAKWSGEPSHRCYAVGLLRTLGMMVLERMAPAGAPAFADSGQAELGAWESAVWGVTNPEVAEKVLLGWRLPHETVAAIRHHCDPGNLHNPIIHLLRIAAATASKRYYGIPGEESYWKFTPETFAKAGLSQVQFQKACERAQQKYDKLRIAVG